MDTQIIDAFGELVAGEVTPALVRQIESGADARPLWETFEASGFLDLLVGEDGAPAADLVGTSASLAFVCGRHAVPVPVWETMIARAVLSAAKQQVPAGPISAAFATSRTPSWQAASVPFAMQPCDVLLLAENGSALASKGTSVDPEHAPAFTMSRDLTWDEGAITRIDGDARRIGALLAIHAAADIAGAADRALSLTLDHAAERKQFGRPIGAFQAIQQALAIAAEHASGARTGFMMGARYWERDDQRDWTADATGVYESAACAMLFAGLAAAEVSRVAHAVFGAMGIAAETDLNLFTRRMAERVQTYGSKAHWGERLGKSALADPEADLLAVARRIMG